MGRKQKLEMEAEIISVSMDEGEVVALDISARVRVMV